MIAFGKKQSYIFLLPEVGEQTDLDFSLYISVNEFHFCSLFISLKYSGKKQYQTGIKCMLFLFETLFRFQIASYETDQMFVN
jgi:hypothetical protein